MYPFLCVPNRKLYCKHSYGHRQILISQLQYIAEIGTWMSQSQSALHYIGGAVTGLMGTQVSLTTVQITWTPISPALQFGYQTAIGLTSMPTNFMDISAPPHNRTVSGTGVQTIVLRSLTRHYPIADVSATVTVLGERN